MTAAACLFVQHGAACGSATVADMVYGAARRTRGADEAPLTNEQLRGDFARPSWETFFISLAFMLPMMSVWPSSTRPLWDAYVALRSLTRPPDGLKQATP